MAVKRAVEIEGPDNNITVEPTKGGGFTITISRPGADGSIFTMDRAQLAELHAEIGTELLDIKTRKRTVTAAPKAAAGQRTTGTKPPAGEKKPGAKELEKGAAANE